MSGMSKKMRWIGCFSLLLLLWSVPMMGSYGQKKEYPEKTIKIYVTTTAGGTSDLWARAWSDEFSKILKVPVVVQPEGGASGMVALIEAAKSKPDGYTLTYIAQSNVVGFAVSTKSPFDLFKDFVPIGACGSTPTIIAVEQSSPFKTFDDLMDYAKKNPGTLKCGTSGTTVVSHFNFELVKQLTNVDVVMVPFKGAPQAATALLGKHVDFASVYVSPLLGLLKAGRVRPLLTTRRLKDFPGVPLFSEKGLAKAGILGWSGLFAPSGIPKEVRAKLIDTFEKVVKYPSVIEKIEALGFTHEYQNPTDLAVQMKEDYEKIKAAAEKAGISE